MSKQREQILTRLSDGESLSSICRDKAMPAWSTVHEWIAGDATFSGQVMRAREVGYLKRADDAVRAALKAEDAALGRLAFDAERWYLGKLSNAFADKQKIEHSGPDGGPIEHRAAAAEEIADIFGPTPHLIEAKHG